MRTPGPVCPVEPIATAAPQRVVIIGGVAGGATAAARIRRLSESAEITILERGPDVSFANCGLPYYVGDEIKDRARLLLHTPASLAATLSIDIRTHHTATLIDRESRTVLARNDGAGAGGANVRVPYDKLILATGSSPIRPPIPGAAAGALPHVFVLRSVSDSDGLKARVDALMAQAKTAVRPPRAVVLGAGFIGLEIAEQLARRGMSVAIVEARSSVLPGAIDVDMAQALEADLRMNGIDVRLGIRAKSIDPDFSGGLDDGSMVVRLESEATLGAEVVVLATGVSPETSLAASAGLLLQDRTKAILVDAHMRTSDPAIYAVGDAVAAPSLLLPAAHTWLPLGGPANRQARIAADHIVTGNESPGSGYRGSLGTSIARVFDTTAACTGLSESSAIAAGLKATTMTVHGFSHAGYYPGAQPITLKAVYDPDTLRLLGAQVVGGSEGVDKRADIIATAISGGAKVTDLAHLELAYAPPFGSARDVVNVLGMAVENAASGLVRVERVRSLSSLPSGRLVLDVRDATTSACHPVPASHGAALPTVLNVPMAELRARIPELDRTMAYTAVCGKGKLAYFAARTLTQAGLDITSLAGGLDMLEREQLDASPATTRFVPTSTAAAAGHASTPVQSITARSPEMIHLDACGLACPGPILELRATLPRLAPGGELRVTASDPGFITDVRAFAGSSGLELVSVGREKGVIAAVLRRPASQTARAEDTSSAAAASACASGGLAPSNNDVSIVVFSGDLDKVLAALVIANGATAMGGTANLFFTFWGLFALKRDGSLAELEKAHPPKPDDSLSPGTHADLLQRMMSSMVPSGPGHLQLSKMNMGGAGAAAMTHIMKSHSLPSVPGLMKSAIASGKVRFVACTMSMEAMGVAPSTLLPGVELGGVADFLATAAKAKTTLFI